MPASPAEPDLPSGAVLPDCCNMGVVLRALLLVNAAVLVASLAAAANPLAAAQAFAGGAAVVELSVMASLMSLCALRDWLGRRMAWQQRAACVLLPAGVTALVAWLIAGATGGGQGGIGGVSFAAAILGAALQHYFELRQRAGSPALAEARLQALQARIRPHFLFNSLNAVLALIRSQPRHAETALEDLADLLRVALRDARDMSTLEAELRLCRQYLAIESLRLGDRLQLEWDLGQWDEASLRETRVPSLVLQPLLENAVHHGVEPSNEPVLIKVGLRRTLDRIEISVANPLQPAASAVAGNRIALANIRERLALLYDVEADLATSASNGQFLVRLRLPLKRSEA